MISREAWYLEAVKTPDVTPRGMRGVLKLLGWELDRHTKHEQWRHPQIDWLISVPDHPSLSKNVVKQSLGKMGITSDDLRYLLSNVLQKKDPSRLQEILFAAPFIAQQYRPTQGQQSPNREAPKPGAEPQVSPEAPTDGEPKEKSKEEQLPQTSEEWKQYLKKKYPGKK